MASNRSIRCVWEVRGGVTPGKPLPECGRVWTYSMDDYEIDLGMPEGTLDTIFKQLRDEAVDYWRSLNEPGDFKWGWADLSWVWY